MKLKYKFEEAGTANSIYVKRLHRPPLGGEWHFHESFEMIYFFLGKRNAYRTGPYFQLPERHKIFGPIAIILPFSKKEKVPELSKVPMSALLVFSKD